MKSVVVRVFRACEFAWAWAVVGCLFTPCVRAGEDSPPDPLAPERGFTTSPRGLVTDLDPFNDTIGGAPFLDLRRRTVVTGRATLAAGDADYWAVFLEENEAVVIITTPLQSLPATFQTPDTIVSVRNDQDVSLVLDDNGGSDSPGSARGSIVRFQAPTAGNYFIRVVGTTVAQTGAYSILFANPGILSSDWIETNNNTTMDADIIPLTEFGPSCGQGGTEGPTIDYYRLALHGGDVLVASVAPVGSLPASWSEPNVRLQVIGTNGTSVLLTSFNDGGADFPSGASAGATLRFRVPRSGTYFLLVQDDSPSASFYTLITSRVPAAFCTGDADGNTTVNFTDITTVLSSFGNACP